MKFAALFIILAVCSAVPAYATGLYDRTEWEIRGRMGDDVILVSRSGETRQARIGSEFNGCKVTEDALVCDQYDVRPGIQTPRSVSGAPSSATSGQKVQARSEKAVESRAVPDEEANSLREQLKKAKDDNAALSEQLKIKVRAADEDTARRDLLVEKLRAENDLLSEKVRKMDQQKSDEGRSKDSLVLSMRDTDRQYSELLENYEKAKSEIESQGNEMLEKERQIKSVQLLLEKANFENASLSAELKKVLAQNAQKEKMIGTKAAEIKSKDNEMVFLKDSEEKYAALSDMHKKTQADMMDLQTRLAERDNELKSKDSELVSLREAANQYKELTGKYKDMEAGRTYAESKIRSLENNLVSKDGEIKALAEQIELRDKELAALTDKARQYEATAEANSGLKEDLKELQAKLKNIGDDILVRTGTSEKSALASVVSPAASASALPSRKVPPQSGRTVKVDGYTWSTANIDGLGTVMYADAGRVAVLKIARKDSKKASRVLGGALIEEKRKGRFVYLTVAKEKVQIENN